MAKYFKYPDAEKSESRINLHVPNFEYLMMKAAQHNFHSEKTMTRYDVIKKAAIYLLGCQMLSSVQIIQDGFGCVEEYYAGHKLPHKLFHWLDLHPEDFEKNRRENLFWLDIMEKRITDKCLDQKKLYNDMEMLQHYIRKLFRAYIFSKMDVVNKELEDMSDYLFKLDTMKDEFDESKKKLKTLTEEHLAPTFAKIISDDEIQPYITQTNDFLMQSAIECRCVNNFCEAEIEAQELVEDKKIRLLQEQIDNYNMKIKNEERAHMHSINAYLLLCDQYRYNRSATLENYDREYNYYVSKISSNLSSIHVMKDQMQFYGDFVKSYHKRIADWKREDEAKTKALRRQKESQRLAKEHRLKMKKLKLLAEKQKQKPLK